MGSSGLAVCFIALSYVVGTAYMAPSIAAIQRLVPAEQRATASAIFLFFSAIVGSAGAVRHRADQRRLKADLGNMSLQRALLVVVPVMHLAAIASYLVASRLFIRGIVVDPQAAVQR